MIGLKTHVRKPVIQRKWFRIGLRACIIYIGIWILCFASLAIKSDQYSWDLRLYEETAENEISTYSTFQEIDSKIKINQPLPTFSCRTRPEIIDCATRPNPPTTGIPMISAMIYDYVHVSNADSVLHNSTLEHLTNIDLMSTGFRHHFE